MSEKNILKKYSDIGEGENLYDAIQATAYGNYNPQIVEEWISCQADSYLSEEYDGDRIYNIIWEKEDTNLIYLFEQKLNIKIEDLPYVGIFTRKELDKNLNNKELNEDDIKSLKELKEAFEKDLENKRENWAYERAREDFDMCFNDIDINNDEEVAEFFGIEPKIEYYLLKDENFIIYPEEIIGFCSECGSPFTKGDLAQYNEELKEELDDSGLSGAVGICPNRYECDESLVITEITDEKIKMMISL